MSEKRVRYWLGSYMDRSMIVAYQEEAEEALATDPDVVAVLRHAKEELDKCEEAIAEADKPGGWVLAYMQEASVWKGLIEWVQDTFHVRLTADGWEWTDE